MKGVPGDLLIPTAARLPTTGISKTLSHYSTLPEHILPGQPNPGEIVAEVERHSRRSSLLSSVELDTPTENKVWNLVSYFSSWIILHWISLADPEPRLLLPDSILSSSSERFSGSLGLWHLLPSGVHPALP